MYRPPKKHKPKKDGILEDPRFSREELEAADRKLHHQDAPKGDDRNLVHVDDAFKEADLEDQVWLFWNKNKHFLIGLFVLVLLGFGGIEGYKLYREGAIASMQKNYSAAETTDEKIAFGENNLSMPLGGFALLEAADTTYEGGDYAKAASLYQQASQGLEGSYLYGRALIGEAMSKVMAGQTEAGKSLLKSISVNGDLLEAIRAQAIYNLGIIALSEDNTEEASRYLQQVTQLTPDGPWGNLASAQLTEIPGALAAAAPVTVEATQASAATLPDNEPIVVPDAPAESDTASSDSSDVELSPAAENAEDAE